MGYFGKLDLQKKAVILRKNGYSIRQIEKELKVSRSSASLWVRSIDLTKKQIDSLYKNKKTGGLKGSYIASQNKIKKREAHVVEIETKAHHDIGQLSSRDRFMLGLSLYYGEGSKTSHSVCFTNSDPHAVLFIKNWLIEFCDIKTSFMRCNLYLHDNLDEKNARDYWSKLLKLPILQFRKTYLVKNNQKRLRRTKHINGICRLTISRVDVLRQILGWIKAVFYV